MEGSLDSSNDGGLLLFEEELADVEALLFE